MGQKVSPTGFRLGITEDWRSRWYAGKDYAKTLENDIAIRKFLDKQLARASVSRVDIERAGDKIKVTITTARPGVVIGKKGAEIDALRKKLEKVADGPVSIDVVEVKRPELDAELIAQSVAEQLEGHFVPVERDPFSDTPSCVLFVGINGAGKTTTVGKIASQTVRSPIAGLR